MKMLPLRQQVFEFNLSAATGAFLQPGFYSA
jgi:hypothetical protein